MRGNPDVVAHLITYLRTELTGHKQYMLHAALCRRAGYERLAERQAAYSDEESRHAHRLLHRVLFLGGAPELSDLAPIEVEATVPGQLRRDRALVYGAIEHLRASIALASARGDEGTRALLEEMLVDEERHLEWAGTQLGLIDALGVERYLQRSFGP